MQTPYSYQYIRDTVSRNAHPTDYIYVITNTSLSSVHYGHIPNLTLYVLHKHHCKHFRILNILWTCPKCHSLFNILGTTADSSLSSLHYGYVLIHKCFTVLNFLWDISQSTILIHYVGYHYNLLIVISTLWTHPKPHTHDNFFTVRNPFWMCPKLHSLFTLLATNITNSNISLSSLYYGPVLNHTLYLGHRHNFKYFKAFSPGIQF